MEHLKTDGSMRNNDVKIGVDVKVKSEECNEKEPIRSSKKQVTIILESCRIRSTFSSIVVS